MKTIIQQIVSEMAMKCLEFFEKDGIGPLDAMAEKLEAISDGAVRDMLAAFIAEADRAIVQARGERMADGIKIRQSRVPRRLFTALGPFAYERTYFDTPEGREHILDGILGVEAYERVDAGVSARLANESARCSFGRSAGIVAGGLLSRQTAKNKAMRVGDAAYVPERAAATPESLHIFADEDHVHMQDGKSAILPLITVCEGKRAACGGRNELVGAFHAQGFGIKPDALWERVWAVLDVKYGMGAVKNVFLYGDGAAWIDAGLDFFPGAIRVLDAFHLKSRMKRLLAGDAGRELAPRARAALARGDKAAFGETAGLLADATRRLMPEGRERAARLKAVQDNSSYIIGHWDEIQNIKLPGSIGSCTEAMVSHILSERFSRNPMGWSEAGLSKMAAIRVYVMNGCRITPSDFAAKGRGAGPAEGKYAALARKRQEDALRGMRDWSFFDVAGSAPLGKRTGTKVALDALGKRRKIG